VDLREYYNPASVQFEVHILPRIPSPTNQLRTTPISLSSLSYRPAVATHSDSQKRVGITKEGEELTWEKWNKREGAREWIMFSMVRRNEH
jgi:hypothetical protein